MTGAGAIAGLVTGAGVVAGWIALGWNKALPSALGGGPGLYEIVPGFAASLLAIVLVSGMTGTGRAGAKA
jgi:SSS family solute:Na+ symporter